MRKFRTLAHHHTPPGAYRYIFHSVLCAGRHRVAPDFPMKSWPHPGHDLLLTVAGSGTVQTNNRSFTMKSGELVWLDGHHHLDVRWPAREEPWEFFWMRIESGHINVFATALNVTAEPIFAMRKVDDVLDLFKVIFKLMRTRPVIMDAALHATVTSLLTLLFEVRRTTASTERRPTRDSSGTRDLAKVLNTMREEYHQRWTSHDFARLMGLSVPQFFRRFHSATGSSPMDWLRRERINQAKHRLAQTDERIDSIAERVGYGDPHYFSRDFKKVVGMSPRQYRLSASDRPLVEAPRLHDH